MSVLVMIVVAQWDEACLAGLPIDDRPWVAHLVTRLGLAPVVDRVVVVCDPAYHALVTPHVPAGTACVAAVDALAWAARDGADLIAPVPVWQLFADPARLTRLAALPRPSGTTLVRAVLERDDAVVLTGGAEVELVTAHGARLAATGHELTSGVVTAAALPEPPELRLRGAADAGWGRTLQRALIAAGQAGDLAAAEGVMTGAGLHRSDIRRDGAGLTPRRVLTVRCLPANLFTWLVAHLGRWPEARVDVVCAEAMAEATRELGPVDRVVTYAGPSFDLAALGPEALAAIRARRYDVCVIPRRTACGRGFENVTPLGEASGAAMAVWMDVTGATGLLAGRPYGWEPWVEDVPPWRDAAGLRARARAAIGRSSPGAGSLTEAGVADAVAAIVQRMDDAVGCHALSDAPDHGLDLAPVFAHQMPGVAAAQAAVAEAVSAGRSTANRLATLVDRALVAGVEHLADAPAGPAAREAGGLVRRHTIALGAAGRPRGSGGERFGRGAARAGGAQWSGRSRVLERRSLSCESASSRSTIRPTPLKAWLASATCWRAPWPRSATTYTS